MIDDLILSKYQYTDVNHQSFFMVGPFIFFFILPKDTVIQLSKERIENHNILLNKQNEIANQQITNRNFAKRNLVNSKKQKKFIDSLKIKKLHGNSRVNLLSSLNILPELKTSLMDKAK